MQIRFQTIDNRIIKEWTKSDPLRRATRLFEINSRDATIIIELSISSRWIDRGHSNDW